MTRQSQADGNHAPLLLFLLPEMVSIKFGVYFKSWIFHEETTHTMAELTMRSTDFFLGLALYMAQPTGNLQLTLEVSHGDGEPSRG